MKHNDLVEMRLCQLLSDRPPELCELALGIRREVCKSANSSSELLYRTYAVSNVFTYSDRLKEAFIHVATYSGHVNLGFNFGTELHDPQNLLQGSGKCIRHIRIDSIDDMYQPALKALVAAAGNEGQARAEEAGRRIPQRLVDKTA